MENIIIKNKRVGTAAVRFPGELNFTDLYVCVQVYYTNLTAARRGAGEVWLLCVCCRHRAGHPDRLSLGRPCAWPQTPQGSFASACPSRMRLEIGFRIKIPCVFAERLFMTWLSHSGPQIVPGWRAA